MGAGSSLPTYLSGAQEKNKKTEGKATTVKILCFFLGSTINGLIHSLLHEPDWLETALHENVPLADESIVSPVLLSCEVIWWAKLE